VLEKNKKGRAAWRKRINSSQGNVIKMSDFSLKFPQPQNYALGKMQYALREYFKNTWLKLKQFYILYSYKQKNSFDLCTVIVLTLISHTVSPPLSTCVQNSGK